MLKSSDNKPEVKNKFEWRMCATYVLKSAIENSVPVLNSFNELFSKDFAKLLKNKFYFQMRSDNLLRLIFDMANETVKKYRITASGFLGELLQYSSQHCLERHEHEELVGAAVSFLSFMNTSEANRNSK